MRRRAIGLSVVLAIAVAGWPLATSPPRGTAAAVLAGRVHAEFHPEDGKIYVLVIGSDARSGNPLQGLADAIHIVGVNTNTMRAGILNFPRDSWVSIPGHGSGKMNEATTYGGPRVLARALERLTGIRLDYWVMTAFQGFTGLIKDLGSVPITLPRPIRDPGGSGADLSAGQQRLRFWEALAFARARKPFKNGDVTRTSNQGWLLLQMLKLLQSQAARRPYAVLDWIAATRRRTRLDIPAGELFRLSVVATQISPRRVDRVTVPVSVGSVGAASVVFIKPGAKRIYARFRRSGGL